MDQDIKQYLKEKKAAILVANGFCEQDVTSITRMLIDLGVTIRIISMEDHGLANSWNGSGWGLHFAADAALKSALAVDYSMLIVPGGQRSADKLRLTAHTKRFINGFLNAGKPVAMMGEAVDLLAFAEQAAGKTVVAPESLKEVLEADGATVVNEPIASQGALITGAPQSDEERAAFNHAMIDHFAAMFVGELGADIPRAA